MEGIEYPSYDEQDDTLLWQYPEDRVAKPSKPAVTPRGVRTKGAAKQREDATSYEAHTDKLDRLIGITSWDWLLNHVTTPYWDLTRPPSHCSYSNKVTVPRGTGLAWLEHKEQTDPLHVPSEVTAINEEHLIKETLWVLLGAEKSFVYELISGRTCVREGLLVGDITQLALRNVLQQFAAVITLVYQLRLFTRQHISWERGGWSLAPCETFKAFSNSLMHYLEAFDGKLRQLEKGMMEKTSFVSLLDLMAELQPQLREVIVIIHVCVCVCVHVCICVVNCVCIVCVCVCVCSMCPP